SGQNHRLALVKFARSYLASQLNKERNKSRPSLNNTFAYARRDCSLLALKKLRPNSATMSVVLQKRKSCDVIRKNQRRDEDFLQRLGCRSTDSVQSRLAALQRRVRGPDVLPRLERLPLHRA